MTISREQAVAKVTAEVKAMGVNVPAKVFDHMVEEAIKDSQPKAVKKTAMKTFYIGLLPVFRREVEI